MGVWAGNSDSSPVTTVANPVFSLDVAAPIWDAFLSEVTRRWEVHDFARPDGLSHGQRRRLHRLRALVLVPRSRSTEFFLRGTSPGEDPYLRGEEVVRGADGGTYLWEDGCEGQPRTRGYLVLDDAESEFPSWNAAVKGWIKRARRGAGVGADVSSAKRTYTAYFYEPYFEPYGQSWGGPFAPTRSCRLAPSASPSASASPSVSPSLEPSFAPSPSAEATPTPEPTPEVTAEPTPKPTKKPKPTPTATPEVTPEPTSPPEPSTPASAAPAGNNEAPQETALAG